MWDVVEHVVDPLSLLVDARKLLKADGLLVLETQNLDSPFARAWATAGTHYKHSEHIYHFTPATIRRLLDRAGFRVDRLTPRFGGKYVSLDFIADAPPASTRRSAPRCDRSPVSGRRACTSTSWTRWW